MTSKVVDNASWSINDMFHELICYCGGKDFQDNATKELKASILAKAHAEGVAEGYRKGCIELDTEWRRGYNQGWDERKAFDLPGGALPASVLAPTKEKP